MMPIRMQNKKSTRLSHFIVVAVMPFMAIVAALFIVLLQHK